MQADLNTSTIPFTPEAAAQLGITAPMQVNLTGSGTRTVSVEAQFNAAQAVSAIMAAQWPGVTHADKLLLAQTALVTMAQESTFFTNKSARTPNGDQDVGPFQQRSKVGWYADGTMQAENVAILQSIPYAALTFIEGHRVTQDAPGAAGPVGYLIPGVFSKAWRTQAPWRTAVQVQVPAKSTYSHYEKWEPVAAALVAAFSGTAVQGVTGSNLYGCTGTGSAALPGQDNTQAPGPWGGFTLGNVTSGLCPVTLGATVKLRCDAAKQLQVVDTEFQRFGNGGTGLRIVGDGYLSSSQLASCTGDCSDAHGWGLAVDLDPNTPGYKWLVENQVTQSWRPSPGGPAGHVEFHAPVGGPVEGWEVGLKPATVAVGRYVEQSFPQITTIGGHRQDVTNDHPSGRAIDVMIPDYTTAAGNALGWQIARDLQAKAPQLGISYLIFDEQIWSVARGDEGWRPYSGKNGSDSARHIDHVHINVY